MVKFLIFTPERRKNSPLDYNMEKTVNTSLKMLITI